MQLASGKFGALLLMIAIMTSVFGGFILNVSENTTCATEYTYVTDISGAFSGTDADVEVDYNPQANLTGYSVFDPTSSSVSSSTLHGINYTTTSANGYWIQETTGDASSTTVTLTNNKSMTDASTGTATIDWDDYDSTTATIEEYYGLYNDETKTQITVSGNTVYRTVGITLAQLMETYEDTFSTNAVYLTVQNPTNSYPCFLVGQDWNIYSTGSGSSRYIAAEITYTDYSTTVKLNPTTNTATLNGVNYGYSDIVFVWGTADTTTVTLDVTIGATVTTYYVDPVYGVQPISIHTESTQITTETNYCNHLTGRITVPASHGASGKVLIEPRNDAWEYSAVLFEYDIVNLTSSMISIFINDTWVWGGTAGDSSDVTLDWEWVGGSSSTYNKFNLWYDVDEPTSSNISATMTSDGMTSLGYTSNCVWTMTTMTGSDYESDYSTCYSTITNEDAGTSQTVTGGNNEYTTVYTTTTAETVSLDYTTTYWYNEFNNTKMSMLVSQSGFTDNSDTITLNFVDTDGNAVALDVAMEYSDSAWKFSYGDNIGVSTTSYGDWPAILFNVTVANGQYVLSVIPVSTFTDFLTYTPLGTEYTLVADGSDIYYLNHLTFPDTDEDYFYHEIVDTTVLLQEGGLYIQDGLFSQATSFPNDLITEFKVMSAAHYGDSMTITTGNSSPVSVVLTSDGYGNWVYNDKTYKMSKVAIYYADEDVESVGIGGLTYEGGLYIKGDYYEKGHLYLQLGENAELTDLGESDSAWSVVLNGTWAVSTAYHTGENVATTETQWSEPGTWQWSEEEFLMVFIGTIVIGLIICAWKFDLTILDWIIALASIFTVYMLLG